MKAALREIITDIIKYWWSADVKTASLEEEPIFGRPLATRFRSFIAAHREFCPLVDMYLGLYNQNADEALWKLLRKTADACAWASRCEFMYQYGSGNSGKDTEHVVSLSFLGDGARGGLSGVIGAN